MDMQTIHTDEWALVQCSLLFFLFLFLFLSLGWRFSFSHRRLIQLRRTAPTLQAYSDSAAAYPAIQFKLMAIYV